MLIVGGAEPATLEIAYPDALVAVLNQHSWILLWVGLFTAIGGLLIWRRNATAVVMTAIVGGAADFGYFLFVDPGGLAAATGPQMTWISAAAILMSLTVYLRSSTLADI